MNTSYKGFDIPEIMPDGQLYHIICDQGIFDGYTEEAVLSHWKNKIDSMWRTRALEDGNIELSDGITGCKSCGVAVFDVYAHYLFHKKFDFLK